MSQKDFTVYNMPSHLATDVLREDTDIIGKWIKDENWYKETRERHFYLFNFMQEHELTTRQLVSSEKDVEKVILRWSDLTPLGQAFLKSRADEKWFASLDRHPLGDVRRLGSNITLLRKYLSKLRPTD